MTFKTAISNQHNTMGKIPRRPEDFAMLDADPLSDSMASGSHWFVPATLCKCVLAFQSKTIIKLTLTRCNKWHKFIPESASRGPGPVSDSAYLAIQNKIARLVPRVNRPKRIVRHGFPGLCQNIPLLVIHFLCVCVHKIVQIFPLIATHRKYYSSRSWWMSNKSNQVKNDPYRKIT